MADHNDYKVVSQNLKLYRKGNGLTQQQVAQALGIDRSTYAYYESGRTMPGLDSVDKLLRLFKINYTDLFGKPVFRPVAVHDDAMESGDSVYIGSVRKKERTLLAKFRVMTPVQQEALLLSMGAGDED